MFGLMTENGPIQLEPGTQQLSANQYAWSSLVDYIWVDNPVYVHLIHQQSRTPSEAVWESLCSLA